MAIVHEMNHPLIDHDYILLGLGHAGDRIFGNR